MPVDHVILAVADLEAAGRRLADEHGLASVAGGVHPAFGTANRIVPVGGGGYVELMAVADPAVAATTAVGRAAGRLAGRPLGWMLAPTDLAATADRLGLAVEPGGRTLPDGSAVAWRLAGTGVMLDEPPLPAFIAWDVPADRHPSAMEVRHAVEPAGIARVEVGGDAAALARWVGPDGDGLDLRVDPDGPAGLRAVAVALADGGEVVLA